MKTPSRLGLRILTAAFVLCAAISALADPPSRVARLQYMSGEVSIQPGGVNDWAAAVVNRPLTTADNLWSDKDSRAELQLGGAFMRISAETSLTLTNVTDEAVQVQLHQGTLNLRIRHLYDGEIYEIDTPNMAFTVTKSGEYRFDVDPDGDTTLVRVWKGEGEATGDNRAVKVHKGQLARFSNGTSLTHQISDVPGFDGFDDWCRVRNQREDHSESARYVSPDVIGAEDLDDYGTWRMIPPYGAVWVPAVAPGWAPYHYGHWVWLDPWGWSWVDDAPWGFAPCHYGRWVYYSGYWGWVPGPVSVRPVYAPALVAWVGGEHWGVSVSFGGGGGVGWFPLGWGEPYIPSYRVSRNYFQNVNVSNTHITNITNVTNNYYNVTSNNTTNITKIKYVNQTTPGAVTAVPATVLTNSQPVARASLQVNAREVTTAPVAVAPPVAPSKASVLGMKAGAPTSAPPTAIVSRPVAAKLVAPPKPLPFVAKQEALASNPGRPLDASTEDQIRAKVARQPLNMRGEATGTEGPEPKPAAVRTMPQTPPAAQRPSVSPLPARNITESQPAPPVPVHNVPRPPRPGVVGTVAPASPVRAAPSAQSQPGTNAEPLSEHPVPRPPRKAEPTLPREVQTNAPHEQRPQVQVPREEPQANNPRQQRQEVQPAREEAQANNPRQQRRNIQPARAESRPETPRPDMQNRNVPRPPERSPQQPARDERPANVERPTPPREPRGAESRHEEQKKAEQKEEQKQEQKRDEPHKP